MSFIVTTATSQVVLVWTLLRIVSSCDRSVAVITLA
jgi:hypothetical protein